MTAEMITQMISNGMGIVLLILFMFYTLKQQREDFQERENKYQDLLNEQSTRFDKQDEKLAILTAQQEKILELIEKQNNKEVNLNGCN